VRSWRFLDTKRWPQARYRSRSVEQLGADRGIVHGDLELHGQRRPLDIAFRLNKLANDPYTFKRTAGFSATATLKRSDYGMDKVLSVVGDAVQLRLEATFVRDRSNTQETQEPAAATTEDGDGVQE